MKRKRKVKKIIPVREKKRHKRMSDMRRTPKIKSNMEKLSKGEYNFYLEFRALMHMCKNQNSPLELTAADCRRLLPIVEKLS